MLDADLRELERAVRANPADRRLSERLLRALHRAGHIEAARDQVEPVSNTGFERGDLALVARPSRPRAAFVWLPEMDGLVGEVARVARLERDGLAAVLEGPSVRAARWPGDPVVGRSFGFGSLFRVSAS